MFKSKTFCIRFPIVLILILLFTWWAGRAVFRYLSQPLATDIETSFGDNKIGIRFPLITFCPNIGLLKKNEIMKDCVDEQYIYLIPTVVACFQKYQNFKTGTLFMTFQPQILNCQVQSKKGRHNCLFKNQSYEIKSPPWTILWFRILGIFSVDNIDRLGVFMFQT